MMRLLISDTTMEAISWPPFLLLNLVGIDSEQNGNWKGPINFPCFDFLLDQSPFGSFGPSKGFSDRRGWG